jgi:SAM-dependent methyltransferase
MKKRAVWIIDEGFLVPALVSVRSFLAVVDMPVCIWFCGESKLERAREAFAEISKEIELVHFQNETDHTRPEFTPSIRNRLARMEALIQYSDELLLLLDADIVFAPGFEQLVDDIEVAPPTAPALWGVPDQSVAWQNQFYFHQIDSKGRKQRLHPGEQMELYEDVFGPEWRYLLGSHGFNNGMLAVYQCGDVAQKWKELYLKGLLHPKVNPDDDQRALSAALVATQTKTHILPEKFNSRGEMRGDYVAFHALSGRWRMPFRSFERGEEAVTDFGKLAVEHWGKIPKALQTSFFDDQQEQIPYRFHAIPGASHFWPMYRSAVAMFEQGHFVEVGCRNGKSTVFMAESIALSGKEIRFDSIACSESFPDAFVEASRNLEIFGMGGHVAIYPLISEEGAELFSDESLDFVSLMGVTHVFQLQRYLETWYPKVKEGGILAGYDFSTNGGLTIGGGASLAIFCGDKGLTFRKTGSFFIIEKKASRMVNVEPIAALAARVYRAEGEIR